MAALVVTLALGACVQSAPQASVSASSGPVRVTNNGAPFAFDQGAVARKVAEGVCAGQGKRLRSGIYDRFEAGAWVYPGGCA